MFTGLVKEIGIIKAVYPNQEGVEIVVQSKVLLPEIGIDDSVAINGACQTAVKIKDNCFHVQTVHVSLEKTTLGSLKSGDEVNLELALQLKDRLGGHLVQGHVNDVAKIIRIDSKGENYQVKLKVSPQQMKYIVKEGSITIDGISLTVSDVDKEGSAFMVSIIPHTWSNTVLRNRTVGSAVNIEVDILGKYVENLLFYKQNHTNSSPTLTEEWIRSKGF
ncbi:riboflavin synthase [Halobacteriovorax sp. HLS]|uniref:riboflavin synthase n=1 Tax=Halobacteriovorax sp. HLS TaxID=2234000 RepID=UPI000FD8F5A4|nr:riboflavin synthase [Halobacteriovorax sp. HLS]